MGVPEAHGAIDTMTSLNPCIRLALINKAKSKKNVLQKGFTLIELLVTVVILGTLSAIAVPAFLGYADDGKVAAAESEAVNTLKACVSELARGNQLPVGCTLDNQTGNIT